MRRRFTLQRRGQTYYAQFLNPITLLVVAGWFNDGIPTGRQGRPHV